ncbi:YhdT family protein [Gemella sp. GL1]|uniref:YhdT family protein n=1 Tax=unclassified Gemella TaxID=2624949 RepID=UPI0034CD3076
MKKNKDYIYAFILAIIHYILWYYFAYIKYADIDPSDYNYILGMPEWFFYSSVVVSIFIIFLVVIVVGSIFKKDIEEEDKRDEKYRKY